MKALSPAVFALERIHIASPCPADWNAMVGDDRVRFCKKCQKNVYNLSAMPHAEAERLVSERESRMCVSFYKRTDGTVLTEDCPVGWRRALHESRRRTLLALTACFSLLISIFGFSGCTKTASHAPEHLTGEVCAPPQTSTSTNMNRIQGDVAPPKSP
jgi:hypothetical protein